MHSLRNPFDLLFKTKSGKRILLLFQTEILKEEDKFGMKDFKTYKKEKQYVNIYNLHDYLFNILEHEMQPTFRILSDDEKQQIMKRYNITKDKEFPDISRFDPVSQAIGVRPGELIEIIRSSPTAVNSPYYRICY